MNLGETGELGQARQRIAELEESLARYQQRLKTAQSKHLGWQRSEIAQIVHTLVRLHDRLLPGGSWRRGGAKLVIRSGRYLYRRVVRWLRPRPGQAGNYTRWLRGHDAGPAELLRQRQTPLPHAPRFCLLADVCGLPLAEGKRTVRSLLRQTHSDWELRLAVPAGRGAETRAWLDKLGRGDARLHVVEVPAQNRQVPAAAALAQGQGTYVGVVGWGDTLAPSALYEFARAAGAHPEADLFYGDEDALLRNGRRADPVFKPDWSPDTLRSHNYIGRLALLRRTLAEEVGGFRPGFPGAEEYDLLLRATERGGLVVHLPRVLYHRRRDPVDPLEDYRAAPAAVESEGARRALEEHLERVGLPAELRPGLVSGTWHVAHRLPDRPLVSILLPNRDEADSLATCVESIHRSSYRNYEILIIENNSQRAGTFACYRRLQQHPAVRVLTWDRPFNYAAVNNFAAAAAQGSVLLFLNNDMQVLSPDWLERLLEHALRPEVGAAGAKLYFPHDTMQHAGVFFGIGGVAGHSHRHYPRWARGYGNRLVTVQNLSAVTGACLMTRREVFEEVNGFDEDFILAFNDVDLCMAIRARGYAIIWTPFAELYHFESKTRGQDNTLEKQVRYENECDLFRLKWQRQLVAGDPFYNPNLTLLREDFGLGTPGEIAWPEEGLRGERAAERISLRPAAGKHIRLDSGHRPFVSVVIANHKGRHYLDDCLRALAAQTYPAGSWEVVLVDNGSRDGLAAHVRTQYPWVRLVEGERHRGFTGGDHLSIRRADGKFVVLLNHDTAVAPRWLEGLVAAAQEDERLRGISRPHAARTWSTTLG